MAERLLLDTHALIWWCNEPKNLSRAAFSAIEDTENMIFASAISAMEIATKYRIGKLPSARALAEDFTVEITREGFLPLLLTAEQGQRGGNLAIPNQDPFDRMLIAQAQIEGMRLVSNEKQFDDYAVLRLW